MTETDIPYLREPNGSPKNNNDFYIEDGKYVFTKEYHLKRGHCCGSGCRHCPFFPAHKKGNTTIFIDNG
jgi:hypothetical protein